jgi:hypothetical protein
MPNSDPVLPSVRAAYIGREYVLLEDCYLFKFTDIDTLYLDAPYKTSRFGVADNFPVPVDKINIGKKIQDTTIIAVIPSGTILHIKDIIQDITFEDGNEVWFTCDLTTNDKVEYRNVDTSFILSEFDGDGSKPPVFNPATAQEIKTPSAASP